CARDRDTRSGYYGLDSW
nr:immunoglobulin heavy chain junction region [Macaca mulatta]MOX60487.1 immunoglobulin heavy chain junction region [Macaca mulatta]MOX61899.1 immunoglobulin heavy chain junction region [Macaca mulatta]MOX65435.1 immunoglobulin heavy chain junction region [Macaca mulatta]MOX65922.1 immunoglobulin heavy chain junction region [Macaca mulatta]